jgi:hypothetical protein
MRWLLDQGLARSAAEMLRQAGHDALHVGEIGRADAADAAILKLAADEQRVVVRVITARRAATPYQWPASYVLTAPLHLPPSVLRPLSSVLRPPPSVLRPLSSVLRPPSSVLRPPSSVLLSPVS